MTGVKSWDEVRASVSEASALRSSSERYALALIGLPGTGKSTLAGELRRQRPDLDIRQTTGFHASGSRMTELIHRLYVEGEREVSLALQLEALARRAILTTGAHALTIIDEPMESVRAHSRAMFEVGLLTNLELASWLLASDVIAAALPQAQTVALVACNEDERVRRLGERGRTRDRSVRDSYTAALESALNSEISEVRPDRQVLRIDTTAAGPRDLLKQVAMGLPHSNAGLVERDARVRP